MKKRCFAFSICFLMLFELCACGGKAPTQVPTIPAEPTTQITQSASEAQLLNIVADEAPACLSRYMELDGTVYATTAENYRLYLTDEYGHTQLLRDEYCTDFQRQGDKLIAVFNSRDVYLYDLAEGTEKLLFTSNEGVSRINMFDDGFTFMHMSMRGDSHFIYYYDTGETLEYGRDDYIYSECIVGRMLCAINYDYDLGEGIVVYSIDTGEKVAFISDLGYIISLFAQDDHLYFNTTWGDYGCIWYELNLDDWTVDYPQIPVTFPEYYSETVYDISENGVLAYHDNYIENEFKLIFYTGDEVKQTGIACSNEIWVNAEDRCDGKILIKTSEFKDNTIDGEYSPFNVKRWYIFDTKTCEATELPFKGRYEEIFENSVFPVLDSSTARKPFTNMVYTTFCMELGAEGTEPLCSKTHGAWLNIADRKADIALLAYPTQEEQDYLSQQGVSVDMKLYGGDGLVFIGNRANGVTDLTVEQIRAIYRGEIRNWAELGGVDAPIRVLYRDDQSGSQRLFESMLWKDEEIPDFEALGFDMLDSMSSIVGECLYDPYSIGYSIMTYLSDMAGKEELLTFSVDGAEATTENVGSGSYPLGTKGYVVIRSDEPEDSPARRLFNWFGTPLADRMLYECGIQALHGRGEGN